MRRFSVHGNPIRVFDGEEYSRGGFFPTKTEARAWADRELRSRGAKARVVKIKGGYQVWGRK